MNRLILRLKILLCWMVMAVFAVTSMPEVEARSKRSKSLRKRKKSKRKKIKRKKSKRRRKRPRARLVPGPRTAGRPAGPAVTAPGIAPPRHGVAASLLPRVYVLPVQPAGAAVSSLIPPKVTAEIRKQLAAQPIIELMAPMPPYKAGGGDVAGRPAAERPAIDTRAKARKALEKGKTFYEDGKYKEAEAPLVAAIKGFTESVAHLDNPDELANANAWLGLSRLRRGRARAAVKPLEAAYILNPTLKLHTLPLPGKVKAVVRSAWKRALKRRKATVTVEVLPAGAWVFLDGDEKGKAPFTVKDVLPGRHYVSARMEGHMARGLVIRVRAGKAAKVTLKLPSAEAGLNSGQKLAYVFRDELKRRLRLQYVDRRAKKLAKGLAGRIRADYLLFSGLGRKANSFVLRSYLYSLKTGLLIELPEQTLDTELLNLNAGASKVADGAIAAVKSFPAAQDITYRKMPKLPSLDKPRAGAAPLGSGRRGTKFDDRVPVYRRLWFWAVIIAVAVVGGAVGAGVGITSAQNAPPKGYQITVTVP